MSNYSNIKNAKKPIIVSMLKESSFEEDNEDLACLEEVMEGTEYDPFRNNENTYVVSMALLQFTPHEVRERIRLIRAYEEAQFIDDIY